MSDITWQGKSNHFWLNDYVSPFCQFVTRAAQANKVIQGVCFLVIAVEFMRWNNVMNFDVSWFLVFITALLALIFIPPDSFIPLAGPVFAVFDASALSMNESRVSLSHHVSGAAQNGTANDTCALSSTWMYFKFFAASWTRVNNFVYSFVSGMYSGALLTTKNAIRLCFKFFFANRTGLYCLLATGQGLVVTITDTATANIRCLCHSFILDSNFLSAISAFRVDHFLSKKVLPSGGRSCCSGNIQTSLWGAYEKKNPPLGLGCLNGLIIP